MQTIIGVRFTKTGKLHYMDPIKYGFRVGDMVVANSERGLELGRVVSIKDVSDVNKESLENPIPKIIKPATKSDIEKQHQNDKNAKAALEKCKVIAKKQNLNMKLITSSYTFDETKLIFYFVSEERVDFRELVKELATEYRTRIELRQVGPRDEIKSYENLGVCGREVCCRTFLPDFETVTIKMAKEQGLQINMTKLSGNCGRIKCCLKYEEEGYKEKLKNLPKVNEIVKYGEEQAKVVALDILKERLKLKIGPQGEERFEVVDVKDIKREKKKTE